MNNWREQFENKFDEVYFDHDLGNEGLFPDKLAIMDFIKEKLHERTRQIREMVVDANNFTNAQVLNKDEWNSAMYQAQMKINALITDIDKLL